MACETCGQTLTWERLAKMGRFACRCGVFAPLTAEEEREELRRDAEQQALKDKRKPEEYDRWPGRAGWVGNAY